MQLEQLLVDSKEVWVPFNAAEGFEVKVAGLSKKELISLRKRCTISSYNHKYKTKTEELDEEKFATEFALAVIKGWKGLTYEILETLVLVDLKGADPSTELEYSEENARLLLTESSVFDEWLNEVAFDLDTFRQKGKS